MAIKRMLINLQTLRRQLSTAAAAAALAAEPVAATRPPPRPKTTTLFDKASKLRSITGTLDEWAEQGKPFTRSELIKLIHHFRNRKDYHSALEVSKWIERRNIRVSNVHHAMHIDLLYRTVGIAPAEEYFKSLNNSAKTEETYGTLLSCYCREKILGKALELFEETKMLGYTSTHNYNNMLSLYCSLDQPQKVVSLGQEMEEKNFAANIFTYSMLMKSYAALEDLDAVEHVLEKMKLNNVRCDWSTYWNLATIYVNYGAHDKASAVLAEMEKLENQPAKWEPENYLICITLYAKMNNLPGVIRVWESLKSNFARPNNIVYFKMLLALSRLGELEQLEKCFKEWEAGCSFFDHKLPNVLLEFYLGRNMVKEATAFYKHLVQRDVEPGLRTLNSFANICIRNDQIDLALKYLETGVRQATLSKQGWFPTEETAKLFFTYFEEKNDASRVAKFIESMKKVNRLDSSVYDSLLLSSTASSAEG